MATAAAGHAKKVFAFHNQTASFSGVPKEDEEDEVEAIASVAAAKEVSRCCRC